MELCLSNMKNKNGSTTNPEPSSSSVETMDNFNLSRTQSKSLQTKWKPGKSLWKYQTKRSVQTKHDVKPVHKRVVDLSNELGKNLGQKHKREIMHLARFKETELCPWKNNENPSKCHTQRRNWTVNSKLQPLSYQPRANFNERFLNNKLAVLGSRWKLGERNDNRISLEQPRNVWVEARAIGSVSGSLTSSQWSEAFTKARVQRLNEVFLSLSEADGMKLRSRRLKCSCLFHQ